MLGRTWRVIYGHLGGYGLFSLVPFGVLTVACVHARTFMFAAFAMGIWYAQVRIARERDRRRAEAIETVNALEDEGVLTTEHASKIRRAIYND